MAQIYITYRRHDSIDIAGRICDRLQKEFGAETVFRDFESLLPSDDFGEIMFQETIQCKVLVVVIGYDWLHISDDDGKRKIDNPDDWVRREIAAFLKRSDARIFPVLVHDGHMPEKSDLPPDLEGLSDRYAITIHGGYEFHEDMSKLVTSISRYVAPSIQSNSGKKVFIVHGHDMGVRESAARFVEKVKLEPIVLLEKPNLGRTIIEKFEEEAKDIGYALVLLTPDDLVISDEKDKTQEERARQNVIFELGYFAGWLGRSKVCLLSKGDVVLPSDLNGILYIKIDDGGGWQYQLAKEMKAAGLNPDTSNLFQ